MSDIEIGSEWQMKEDAEFTCKVVEIDRLGVVRTDIPDRKTVGNKYDFAGGFLPLTFLNIFEPKVGKIDMVNKPPHYKDASGIECKEITCHREMPFSLGNAIKYLYRAGSKGDLLEDLKKADWYLRVAYLNDERVPKAVEVRLLEVAAHRKTVAGRALNLIRLHEIAEAYQAVKKEIEKLEAGSE